MKSFEFYLQDNLFEDRHAIIHYNFEPGEPASFTSNHDDPGYSDPGSEDWYEYKVMIGDLDVSSIINDDIVIDAIRDDIQEGY